MSLPCIIFEIKRDIGQKLQFFIPPAFDVPVTAEVPVGILPSRLVWKTHRVVCHPAVKKYDDRFSRVDTRVTDGRTDRQTSFDSIVRAMHIAQQLLKESHSYVPGTGTVIRWPTYVLWSRPDMVKDQGVLRKKPIAGPLTTLA